MNKNRFFSLFLPFVLTLLLITSLFISCSNAQENTLLTTTGTSNASTTAIDADTFGDYASKGMLEYNSSCSRCHGNSWSTGTYAKQTLSNYINAKLLLNKINTMSGGYGQTGLEVLSYFLVEHGWVSADEIFDPDALSDILLTR